YADLGGGISAEANTYRNVDCADSGDDWTCNCYEGGRSAGIGIPAESSPSATCATALDICSDAYGVSPNGPFTCEFASKSSGSSYCAYAETCGATAPIDGEDVFVFGRIETQCYMRDTGTYGCDCFSGGEYETFQHTTEAPLRDGVCVEAQAICRELVDVQIGSGGGGGIGRPVPVPF